ncbi:MAG: sodium:solute symporter [Phycisphaerae bacterium]|jgi:SSS family solute:Na+ symporter|nr:sodium:solute symporter [Phycisphaerae bacterium]
MIATILAQAPKLTWLDWTIIGGYFAIIAVVAWLSSRKQNTSEDYFLAGRNIGWFAIGGSLFASNIGSEHVVGLAGSGSTSGMMMAHYELHAWCLLMLGWVFIPFYKRSGVFTMPEFLEKRFNATARGILTIVSLLAYVFTKVSVTVYAGGMVIATILPELMVATPWGVIDPFWTGALLTVVLTGIYTIFGGLRAVVWTDAFQAIILLVGAATLTLIELSKLGGWDITNGWQILRETVSVNKDNFSLWRPWNDPDFPWVGVLFGAPIVGIWYWCTDQYIVQRALAARDIKTARRATIWGAVLKISPVLVFLVPGMIAWALQANGALTLPVDLKGKIVEGKVFPTLVTELLPTGIRGLVVGGLLAALMSSLSSLFNSCSSLFTIDIYEKLNPEASEKHLVTVGRLATGMVVALGILWIPIMPMVSKFGLYGYLQTVQAYLGPPITAVFLLGLFSRRVNGAGAVAGLTVGFTLAMAKLACQIANDQMTGLGLIGQFGAMNWLYFSLLLFGISVVTIVIVSLLTPRQTAQKISGLTYASLTADDRKELRESWNLFDVIITAAILAIIVGIYIYFSFGFWTT